MRKISTAAILFTGAALLATVSAASASASPSVSAKAKTCAAFAAWERHHSRANLDAMVADSFTVSWKYLGEDADGLYRDVRGGKTQYIAGDEKYLREDCG